LTICSHDVEFLHASLHHLRRVSRDIVLVAGDRMHDGRTAERLDVVKSAVAEHSDVRDTACCCWFWIGLDFMKNIVITDVFLWL
jgi:hypothetical protein